MWIGDFVRCHTIVRLLKARFPRRPIDVVTSTLTAPLVDYMPGVRRGIVSDMPRRRLGLREQLELGGKLRAEDYGTALIMSRKWKAALAPFLARIPERVGFVGEGRFLLLNDLRWGERKLARMIDQCVALSLPRNAALPDPLPPPQLVVPASDVAAWRAKRGINTDPRRVIAMAPGAVGPSKRWPADHYGDLARRLIADGFEIWVLGSSNESPLAAEIAALAGTGAKDLTGPDLRDAIFALAGARAAVSNDSGLLHVAAALDTPAIGIFGPTSAQLWAPLNPLAGVVETQTEVPCRPCHQPVCRFGHHRCMREIDMRQVIEPLQRALARSGIGSDSAAARKALEG
jgi:heptosyltransferase-2